MKARSPDEECVTDLVAETLPHVRQCRLLLEKMSAPRILSSTEVNKFLFRERLPAVWKWCPPRTIKSNIASARAG